MLSFLWIDPLFAGEHAHIWPLFKRYAPPTSQLHSAGLEAEEKNV